MFFRQDYRGHLRQPQRNAMEENIFSADKATLKLDNQENLCKRVCVYQEHNVDERFRLVRVLGRQLVSIRNKAKNKKTYFSAC